jgi:hypothetical protein
MKSRLILITALFFLTTACQAPKDSEGQLYEFRCEKRPECDNKYGLVQIAYGTLNQKPDLTQSEVIVFCCDRLLQSIDSLKKYRDLMGPFNDSLKGWEWEGINDESSHLKFEKFFYFDEGEDSVCIVLTSFYFFSPVLPKEMVIWIGHQNKGRIYLQFTGRKELDEYIELLEGNYKNCCP